MHSRLDRITDWDVRAANAGCRIGILAKECGVSERQLRRYVRARFGQSPASWMTMTRLNTSTVLLARGLLVKEAAGKMGFKQPSHFSRRFKQFLHANPQAFIPLAVKMSVSDNERPI
jgi:AraC-like DNA-binding protein